MRFTSRSSRNPLTRSVVVAVFLLAILALSALGLVRRGPTLQAGKATIDLTDDTPHYTGSIVIPHAGTRFCRHLLFDHATGEIREVDPGECLDLAPAVNSTEGRIGVIRRSFSKSSE